MSELINQAKQKLDDEVKNFEGSNYANVIYKDVAATLKNFCDDERFAAAIIESNKTLSDCCKTSISDFSGSGISDLEVYKRAAEFYFPTATVQFKMEICLNGPEESQSGKIVSLLDLL